MDTKTVLVVGGVAAVAVAGLVMKNKVEQAGGVTGFFQDIAADGVSVVVDAVEGTATGVILGAGDVLGIPRTELNECELAIREGRTWDASFACPAGRFLEYVTTGK